MNSSIEITTFRIQFALTTESESASACDDAVGKTIRPIAFDVRVGLHVGSFQSVSRFVQIHLKIFRRQAGTCVFESRNTMIGIRKK